MKRATIEFVEATQPIRNTVTKFGGQPVWLGEPLWPRSRQTGAPMRFIGQIRLDEELFGALEARMAYLFMTDDEEYVDGTWEPTGGENAVVLLPGGAPEKVKTSPLETGPTLYRRAEEPGGARSVPEACEYAVRLTHGDEPPPVDEDVLFTLGEDEERDYAAQLEGNKLGGSPLFLQGSESPGSGEWKLLLQLDSTTVPFAVNFGDSGVGYAFLSADGRKARFLWQGC